MGNNSWKENVQREPWPKLPDRDYGEMPSIEDVHAMLARLRDGVIYKYGRTHKRHLYNAVVFLAYAGCRPVDVGD